MEYIFIGFARSLLLHSSLQIYEILYYNELPLRIQVITAMVASQEFFKFLNLHLHLELLGPQSEK